MRKNTPLQLKIPEPCNQSWNEMLPEEDGRHCLSCQKKVIDFSGMTDQELIRALAKAGSGSCGRFDVAQLERNIMPPARPSGSLLPAAALALTIAVSAETVRANHVVDTTQSVKTSGQKPLPQYLEAQVIDSLTGKGMRGVTVSLMGTAEGTITDLSGCFRLSLPAHFKGLLTLKISYLGYEVREIGYDSQDGFPQTIILNQRQVNMNEIVVTGYATVKGRYTTGVIATITATDLPSCGRRTSFWQRIRNIFHKHPKSELVNE